MNNNPLLNMKKYFKTVASVMVLGALLLSALVASTETTSAFTGFGFGDGGLLDGITLGAGAVSSSASNNTYTKCVIDATRKTINAGESVTLNWDTSGFSSLTINGEALSGNSGSKTFNNVLVNTTYTLYGVSDSGSTCTAEVKVTCIQPPVVTQCKLIVEKTVNKSTAVPGDELTYTITVKNIGDADCTGGGVKIDDVLDPNITYVRYTVSGNLTAGYAGTVVYTASDRTLHFNGNTLNPNESGTITWVGKVNNPTQCGDFEVKNQAKATALELNNFQTWVYSQTVKTAINNDCSTPKPCELVVEKTVNTATAIPEQELTYTITVKNIGDASCTGSGVMIEDVIDPNVSYLRNTYTSNLGAGYLDKPVYTSSDRTLHFNGFELTPNESGTIVWVGKVNKPAQCGDFEVKNQAKATALELSNFQTWAYSQIVKTTISYKCDVPKVPECTLTPATQAVAYGGTATLNWTTKNANAVTLTSFGNVDLNGTKTTGAVTTNGVYTLVATGAGGQVSCVADVSVGTPVPSCDLFTANPGAIRVGSSTLLTWETTNATQVVIDNGVGTVAADGSINVSPLVNVTYKLTAIGTDNKTHTCEVPVVVSAKPLPLCESFTATPNTLPVGGGTVALNWKVTNASSVNISPLVGVVSLIGNKSVNVTSSTNFNLTATDSSGATVSCVAPVTVPNPEPVFSCANSVTFSASSASIRRGDSSVISWSTKNVDTVAISSTNATALAGSQSVSPISNITYVLTATQGSKSISCPLPISVTTGGGGGGGGSISPRCELTISDNSINSGEQITLKWDTSNATEVTLTDDKGKEIFTTADHLSKDKKDYYDGSIKLKPTRDTKYTLLAERGSRDVECKVSVVIKNNTVVLQTRDQQPLVAGISLSQVPYTGFEAGPIMTLMFYLLLVAWAAYIAYVMVIRKQVIANGDVSAKGPQFSPTNMGAMKQAEFIRPDVFVSKVVTPSVVSTLAPSNLPVGTPVIGYENHVEEEAIVNPHQATDEVVTNLENRAHEQKALLSSDAVRYFIATTSTTAERNQKLDVVIADAKKHYPLEDGWIVINETRMRNLCVECQIEAVAESKTAFIPATIPEGSGSLAEAIVTGNIVAAYEMIGNRPMFALADAASDLDSVVRHRKGEKQIISDLLLSETEKLSDEKIKNMITALTGAIDGTYNDEASAVKMAIMKAVKEVA
ncbi:MAG: hypothetical protein RLZZ230_56 [Candidatus Parcubacteria bacterium]|jgi:uncharacterized repeat protein (TIGR01451 family)